MIVYIVIVSMVNIRWYVILYICFFFLNVRLKNLVLWFDLWLYVLVLVFKGFYKEIN